MDNLKTPTLFEIRHSKKYDDVINACNEYPTMAKAAESTGIPHKTFIRIAKKLGCYKPNQSGKGIVKLSTNRIPLDEILNGKHPQYGSSKLRIRLVNEGLKELKCECCGISEWNGLPAPLELDHIDGNNSNHVLENLRILCSNCHAQTPTYSCKKSRNKQQIK
jgi:5-methylcytosine-specific restriction endonuclease McrA